MTLDKAYEVAKQVAQEKNSIVSEYLILPSGIVFTLSEGSEEGPVLGATQIKVKYDGTWELFDINLHLEEFADSGNRFVSLLGDNENGE